MKKEKKAELSPVITQQTLQVELLQIPIEPKEKPIEFDIGNIPFPKYKYSPDEPKKKRGKKTLSKPVRLIFTTHIVKKQQNKEDKIYQVDILGYSDLTYTWMKS